MILLDSFLEHAFIPMYGITLLVALWHYPKYYSSSLKFFPVLLLYTLLSELLGFLVREYDQFSLILDNLFQNYNWVIFNVYNLVFFLYFFYVFRLHLKQSWHHWYLLASTVLLVMVSVYNAMKYNFLLESQIYSYLTGGVLLLGAIGLYFRQQYLEYGHWFHQRDLLSWLSLGMLIFYSGYMPIKVMHYYAALYLMDYNPVTRRVHLLLILLMYACFITGFVRMGRQRQHS